MKKQILFIAFCLIAISGFSQIDTSGTGGSSGTLDVIDTILKSVFTLLSSVGIPVPYQSVIIIIVGFIWRAFAKARLKKQHEAALSVAAKSGVVPDKKLGFFKRLFGKK